MKIKYLGTGAAEGVPAMFCKCPACNRIRAFGASEYRTRSQVIIDDIISVDFPPEAYVHSLYGRTNCADLKYLFITHSHMDHFYAHDFVLRGYKYGNGFDYPLEIYGNAEVAAVFAECTAREMKPSVSPNIKINVIKSYSEFFVGNYKVLTMPARHSQTEDAMLFYVEKSGSGYLHFYDTALPEEEVYAFLRVKGAKARVVSLDCTYADIAGTPRPRHMNIEDCAAVREKLLFYGVCDGNTKFVITHFSHNADPLRSRLADIEKRYGVTAAYDGMEIEL